MKKYLIALLAVLSFSLTACYDSLNIAEKEKNSEKDIYTIKIVKGSGSERAVGVPDISALNINNYFCQIIAARLDEGSEQYLLERTASGTVSEGIKVDLSGYIDWYIQCYLYPEKPANFIPEVVYDNLVLAGDVNVDRSIASSTIQINVKPVLETGEGVSGYTVKQGVNLTFEFDSTSYKYSWKIDDSAYTQEESLVGSSSAKIKVENYDCTVGYHTITLKYKKTDGTITGYKFKTIPFYVYHNLITNVFIEEGSVVKELNLSISVSDTDLEKSVNTSESHLYKLALDSDTDDVECSDFRLAGLDIYMPAIELEGYYKYTVKQYVPGQQFKVILNENVLPGTLIATDDENRQTYAYYLNGFKCEGNSFSVTIKSPDHTKELTHKAKFDCETGESYINEAADWSEVIELVENGVSEITLTADNYEATGPIMNDTSLMLKAVKACTIKNVSGEPLFTPMAGNLTISGASESNPLILDGNNKGIEGALIQIVHADGLECTGLTLKNVTIKNCNSIYKEGNSYLGSAVCISGSEQIDVELSNCSIINNVSDDGCGAVYIDVANADSVVKLNNCKIKNNKKNQPYYGVGVYLQSGILDITDCEINENYYVQTTEPAGNYLYDIYYNNSNSETKIIIDGKIVIGNIRFNDIYNNALPVYVQELASDSLVGLDTIVKDSTGFTVVAITSDIQASQIISCFTCTEPNFSLSVKNNSEIIMTKD